MWSVEGYTCATFSWQGFNQLEGKVNANKYKAIMSDHHHYMRIDWSVLTDSVHLKQLFWQSSTKPQTITFLVEILEQTSGRLSNQSQEAVLGDSKLKHLLLVFGLFHHVPVCLPFPESKFPKTIVTNSQERVYSLVQAWIPAVKSIYIALPFSNNTISFVSALTSFYDVDLLMSAAKVHSDFWSCLWRAGWSMTRL